MHNMKLIAQLTQSGTEMLAVMVGRPKRQQ
jgi:hypothetical protein